MTIAVMVHRGHSGGGKVGRADKIRWATLYLTRAVSAGEAALANGINRRTFSRWLADLLSDGQPDTDDLRLLERGSR